MLMGHPPQIIACGRENGPQGCFEGLTPVQVSMVVQELIAYDSEVQEALADTLELIIPHCQMSPKFLKLLKNGHENVSRETLGNRVPDSICA